MTFNEIRELELQTAKAELNQLVNSGYVVFITGRSGSGKDFVSSKLMSNPERWCLLDHYGKRNGDAWVVNIPADKLAQSVVFVGIADHMPHLVKQISERSKGKLATVWIMPSPEIYRTACAAKAASAKDVPESWVKSWLSNSKLSDSRIRKELLKKRSDMIAKVRATFKTTYPKSTPDDCLFFSLANDEVEGSISSGWYDWVLSDAVLKSAGKSKGGEDAKS